MSKSRKIADLLDSNGDVIVEALEHALTDGQEETLKHIVYEASSRKLVADRAIETTLNSLYLGEQHKMSSGSENIFFTNLSSDINFFPMWGGLKDQSIVANQGASGFIPPSGRVFSDMFSLPLGGAADPLTSIGYDGDNYFGINISGLGITTVAAEAVGPNVRLEYRIVISGKQVYMQELPRNAMRSTAASSIWPNDTIEWFFDHPIDVRAGTTLRASIMKVDNTTDEDLGIFLVRQGDTVDPNTGLYRYQATVHNRLFEDKDLELISPYLKYKAMDFSVDDTGVSILLKDLSLAAGANLLIPHNINTLEAVAEGTEIKIKIKGGSKIIIESLPVNAVSINGSFVNSILNLAVTELNNLFTNTLSFASQGNPVLNVLLSENYLTVILEDLTSFSVDITTLGVDTNNFVSSGVLNGTDLVLTMSDATTVTVDASGLSVAAGVTVSSGSIVGSNIVLTMSDASTVTIDATSLNTGTSTQVSSGVFSGNDLILTMADGSQVTIDATNTINGSTDTATNDSWFFSYGSNANSAVGNSISDLNSGIAAQAPFYFGTAIARGSEFKWNANHSTNRGYVLGLWDGAEAIAGTYNSRQGTNWSTGFWRDTSGFRDGSNTTLTNTTATGRYVTSANAPVAIRFLNDGHIVVVDLSVTPEVEIAKTINPIVETTFNIQLGCDAGLVLPNAIISESDNLWEIVHDYAGTEAGILNGILDHTVIKSSLSIVPGEKMMFMLDQVGRGDFFGTNYTNAATGINTAETQLSNTFYYQTNEAIVMTLSGATDWTPNTSANGYFYAANLHQYRNGGGSGTIQGMHSLRYAANNDLELWDEDTQERIATATAQPDGSPIHLYFGVKGNRVYTNIAVISKQSLGAGSQPVLTFAPDVSNQSFTVDASTAFSLQIALDGNSDIVNMYGEVDSPTWAVLNQVSGVFIGTAPAYTGSSDSYVVNCKAANAIGGITNFTVTINVVSTAYTNAKSLSFNGTSNYIQGNATNVTAFERATNGDGNAWTIAMWVKPSTSTATQTLLVYGAGDDSQSGAITLQQHAGANLILNYGTIANKLIVLSTNCLTIGSWNHVVVTFDGGTTGSNQADLAAYYGRFGIAVDGVAVSQIGSHSNYGYTGVLTGTNTGSPIYNMYRIGRASNVHNNYAETIVNQVAIWNSDQSANVSTIYNSGATQDLSLLSAPPVHYYEIETSVTSIPDLIGSADLTGYNFTSADLVTDTP